MIKDKTCSVIIDSGSCANIVSTTVIQKLSMSIRKHPTHYKLQWINDSGELKVVSQALISFTIR